MGIVRKIAAAAAVAAALSTAASATELSFGHVLAEGAWYHDVALKFKEVAEAQSGGAVTVNIFPSGQLGGELKVLQNAMSGAPIVAITSVSPIENFIPEFAVFSMPYVFDDIGQANAVIQGPMGKTFLEMMPARGLVGLGYLHAPERNVFGTRAVRTVDDLNGMKIRVIQAPSYVATYEAFGAQPTPMAYTEQYLALQNKVVDGAEAAPEVLILDKLSEVSTHYNMTKSHYMPIVLSISAAAYDGMPAEEQDAVREAAAAAIAVAQEGYQKLYDDSIAALPGLGIEVVQTDLTGFREKAKAIRAKMLESVPNGQALLDQLLAAKTQ